MNLLEGIDVLESILKNGYNYNGIEIKPINPIKVNITLKDSIITVKFEDKYPTLIVSKKILFLKPKLTAPISSIVVDTKKRIITVGVEGWPDQEFEY